MKEEAVRAIHFPGCVLHTYSVCSLRSPAQLRLSGKYPKEQTITHRTLRTERAVTSLGRGVHKMMGQSVCPCVHHFSPYVHRTGFCRSARKEHCRNASVVERGAVGALTAVARGRIQRIELSARRQSGEVPRSILRIEYGKF